MVLEKVKGQEWGYGFDANTEEYVDLLEKGVCDPASVTTWCAAAAAAPPFRMVGEGGVGVGGRPLATRPSPAAPAARRALDNAVSIAASLLNTEAIVAEQVVEEI